MKFKLVMNPHGQVYFPKIVREDLLEGETTLELHSNLHVGVLTSANQDPEKILDSMETLLYHFKQIAKENERQMGKNPKRTRESEGGSIARG